MNSFYILSLLIAVDKSFLSIEQSFVTSVQTTTSEITVTLLVF